MKTPSKSAGGRPRKEGLRPLLKKERNGKYFWRMVGYFPGEEERVNRSLQLNEPDPKNESRREEALAIIRKFTEKAAEAVPELPQIPVIDEKSRALHRPDRVTVAWVLDTYVQHSKDELARPHRVRPLARHLGDMEITDIRASTGAYYYHQRQKDRPAPPKAGKDTAIQGVSRSTVIKDLNNFYTALRWVSRDPRFAGIFEEKGIDVRDLYKNYKFRMEAPSLKEVADIELHRKSQRIDRPDGERPMSVEDFYEIFDTAAPHVQIYLMLATLCGARKGAILGLTWDRISLQPSDPYIDFHDAKKRITNKRRPQAVLPEDIRRSLAEWRETQKAEAVERKVPAPTAVITWKCRKVNDITNGFNKAMARADRVRQENGKPKRYEIGRTAKGWPQYRYSPHMLKSFFVTLMIRAGMPLEDVSSLTKTNIDTLREYYQREVGAYDEYREKAFARPSVNDSISVPQAGFIGRNLNIGSRENEDA